MALKVKRFDFGVWDFNVKQTILILSFFHTLLNVIYCASAQSAGGAIDKENQHNPTDNHYRSWDITSSDKNAALYTSLIDILEKLNLVPIGDNSSSCVILGNIVREVEYAKSDGISKSVLVTFHFSQILHSTVDQGSAQIKNSNHENNSRIYSIDGVKSPSCSKNSRFLKNGLDSFARKQDDTGAKSMEETDKTANGTGAILRPSESNDEQMKGEDKGLSRTQVVVISTCTAVIALFFLIAGTIRIRNYYKRYRSRQDNNQTPNSRGSSLRLPGSTSSSGNLRRDSSCSKASRQSHSTNKSNGDNQITRLDKHSLFPHSSPALALADQKPLLPGLSSLYEHSNASSHGSIAFIDEDSSSKIKASDGNDDGSEENEDFPLLRKSPDSGSYVSLAMEAEKETSRATEIGNENVNKERNQTISDSQEEDLTPNEDNTEEMLKDTHEYNLTPNDERLSSIHGSITNIMNTDRELTDVQNYIENENICDTCVVNVGLNQSNSSLTENPSYSYGNQVEYSPFSGFDNGYGYVSENDFIKDNTFEYDYTDDSGHVSSFLENESSYRANGSYDDVTDGFPDIQSDRTNSPGSLSSEQTCHKVDIGTPDTNLDIQFSKSNDDGYECQLVIPHQAEYVVKDHATDNVNSII